MGITNTSAQGERGWTMGTNPSAIERQEAAGQRELAKSSQLPTEGLATGAEQHGIKVLSESKGDGLFSDVELPDGMRIVPTDHSMWSDLVTADGKKIAGIFYKAVYYDRNAFIRWEQK